MDQPVNTDALKSEIRAAVINQKANACPMVARLAWHASGTFDKSNGTGGSNGATMRFDPEKSDDANAGLGIIRDMLHPVKKAHPEVSHGDLWTYAGTCAVEFLGGPKVPHQFGRTDAPSGVTCPENGRLPDASQGAEHVRDVFYRMGFNDQEIVALCGAHTLGRCHKVRSGYDGPWTRHPLKFDNTYFKNLLELNWKPRKWDGKFQYEDDSGELMMLPTDMALKTDPQFRVWVEKYAADQELFFRDFAAAFGKLLALGVPAKGECPALSEREKTTLKFREDSMHGSVERVSEWAKTADVHAVEPSSGRTALHKAAFWGHDETAEFLVNKCKINVDAKDCKGDTALHDATRFGHEKVVDVLLAANADASIRNNDGMDAVALAVEYSKDAIAAKLARHQDKKLRSKL